jgi:lysophospholipase L1-like esterase
MSQPSQSLSLKKRLMFGAILLIGLIAIIEVLASLYYYWGLPAQKREMVENLLALEASNEYDIVRFQPHPYFNYVGNPNYRFPEDGYQLHNSRGFRQPEWPETKPPGTIRIIAVGGSTTYGAHYREHTQVWPFLLETQLNASYNMPIEVFNLGLPSYTTHEILGVVSMLAPVLEPDILVIHVGANEAFTACYPDEGGPDNTNARFSWKYQPLPEFAKSAMRRSFLLRYLGFVWASKTGRLPGNMITTVQYPPPDDATLIENVRKATGKYFRDTLSTLLVLSRHIGATPVLLTHPLHAGWNPEQVYYQSVIPAMHRNNDIIREVGAEYGELVIDLYAMMQDPVVFLDAIHASPEGMQRKAEIIGEQIAPIIENLSEATQSHE